MSGPNPCSWRLSSCKRAFWTPRCVSAYSRNQDSFEGVFRVGECTMDADEDARRRVGVEGGFEGMRAMDATLERICERCARSLDMPWDGAGVETDSGRWWRV